MDGKHTPPPHYAIGEQPPPADTGFVKRKYLDLPYAHVSSAQKLDIYLPYEGDGPYPVIIAIHGGAFLGCDKADTQVLPMLEGLKRGYAVVSINYRLSWEAKFPALIQDAKAAVRWVLANAAIYHFDPQRIAAWGGSAGGYQTDMLGVSAGVPELEDPSLGNPEQPCRIQAAISWFAPTNFLTMDDLLAENGMLPPKAMRHSGSVSPESLLLGAPITTVPELVQAANPETYIRPNACPFLIQHGTADPIIPVQQSIQFAEKLASVIGKDKVRLDLLEGAVHADPAFETPQNVQKVLDFLDTQLR